MSKIVKLTVLLGVVAAVTACGQRREETVVVEPAPMVQPEPVSGKF